MKVYKEKGTYQPIGIYIFVMLFALFMFITAILSGDFDEDPELYYFCALAGFL